jgi:uncharacterized protein YcbX
MTPTVAGLFVYPIKSCRGIAPRRAIVAVQGFEHDRAWMVVDPGESPMRFLTQREIPRMALIRTALTPEDLVLEAPEAPALRIPLGIQGDANRAVVWRSTVDVFDQGDDVARWLSEFTGRTVRLVRFDQRTERPCNPEFAGNTGANTQFADGYPILVIGSASLADLNQRLEAIGESPLPMNRFRPNLVVDGLGAYDEDHLAALRIGDVELQLVKPCTRCQITTTDQDSAAVGRQPLQMLGSYRNDPRFGGVTFGMNAVVTRGAGRAIGVGDTVELDWSF